MTIDVHSLEFHCTCEGAYYRPGRACSHVKIAAGILIESGDLAPEFLDRVGKRMCIHCAQSQMLFAMCNDEGAPLDGLYICRPCVQSLQQTKTPNALEWGANEEIEPFADEDLEGEGELPEPLIFICRCSHPEIVERWSDLDPMCPKCKIKMREAWLMSDEEWQRFKSPAIDDFDEGDPFADVPREVAV